MIVPVRLAAHAASLMLAIALCPSALHAQSAPRYEVDASWPKDLPDGWITGQLLYADGGASLVDTLLPLEIQRG